MSFEQKKDYIDIKIIGEYNDPEDFEKIRQKNYLLIVNNMDILQYQQILEI